MRSAMSMPLNKSINDYLKMKKNIIKDIKNIDVNVYEYCSNNFYRISDKNLMLKLKEFHLIKPCNILKKLLLNLTLLNYKKISKIIILLK